MVSLQTPNSALFQERWLKTIFFISKETPDKNVLAKELHALLKGEQNYQKLVLAHDTARVVQCLLKFSPAEIKREISEVLLQS